MFWRDWPLTSVLVTTPSTVNAFSAPLAPFTWKPPSISPEFTDGAVSAIDWNERPFGSRSNLLRGHVVRDQRAARVDERRSLAGDLDHLGQRADAQLRVELERAAEHDADVRPLDLREAGQLEPDGVAARHEVGRDELPVGVGDERPDLAEVRLVVTTVTPGNAPLV